MSNYITTARTPSELRDTLIQRYRSLAEAAALVADKMLVEIGQKRVAGLSDEDFPKTHMKYMAQLERAKTYYECALYLQRLSIHDPITDLISHGEDEL